MALGFDAVDFSCIRGLRVLGSRVLGLRMASFSRPNGQGRVGSGLTFSCEVSSPRDEGAKRTVTKASLRVALGGGGDRA